MIKSEVVAACAAKLTWFLALSLLVFGIFGTNNHNFAITFDNLALVAHGLYRRFYFHFVLLDTAERRVVDFYCCGATPLVRQTILPLVRSYGLISNLTASPGKILMEWMRNLPET